VNLRICERAVRLAAVADVSVTRQGRVEVGTEDERPDNVPLEPD